MQYRILRASWHEARVLVHDTKTGFYYVADVSDPAVGYRPMSRPVRTLRVALQHWARIAPTERWAVRYVDTWRDPEGGWYVNDRGSVIAELELIADAQPREILKALREYGIAEERGCWQVEDWSDWHKYVCWRINKQPVYELERIDE